MKCKDSLNIKSVLILDLKSVTKKDGTYDKRKLKVVDGAYVFSATTTNKFIKHEYK